MVEVEHQPVVALVPPARMLVSDADDIAELVLPSDPYRIPQWGAPAPADGTGAITPTAVTGYAGVTHLPG